MEGVHVERHVIVFALIIGNWHIDIVIEFSELIHIIPDHLIRSMEDMWSIFMDLNAFNLFCVDIARDITAFFNDEDFIALFIKFISTGCSE